MIDLKRIQIKHFPTSLFLMKNIVLALLFCFSLLLFACDDDALGDGKWSSVIAENPGDQVDLGIVEGGLYNGNMELVNGIESNLPSGWKDLINNFNAPNNYDFELNDRIAIDNHSIAIIGDDIDSETEFGLLRQRIINPTIPVGAFLRLRGQVRTSNLSGNGFNMVVVGYDIANNQVFYSETFAESRFASGTQGWQEYTSNTASVPIDVEFFQVFLTIGGNTTGTVYFDDIVLEYD